MNIIQTGSVFNNLTFRMYITERTKENRIQGIFVCRCGRECIRPVGRVVGGYIKNCGDKSHLKGINKKHGGKYTPEYSTWNSMKDRVLNKKNKDYSRYRHLTIDEDIAKDFTAFLKEVGKRPSKKYSLDRIDNTRGYVKGNMRWATRTTQQTNKSNTVIVTVDGKQFTGWISAAKYFNVSCNEIIRRCKGGFDKRRENHKCKGILPPKPGYKYELLYKEKSTGE